MFCTIDIGYAWISHKHIPSLEFLFTKHNSSIVHILCCPKQAVSFPEGMCFK